MFTDLYLSAVAEKFCRKSSVCASSMRRRHNHLLTKLSRIQLCWLSSVFSGNCSAPERAGPRNGKLEER